MKIIQRPITPLEEFEKALELAELSESDKELIEYIRYKGVFSQPTIVKELRLKTKPPVLSTLCVVCRKIGKYMPDHFGLVREWSKSINEHGVKWDGDLVCSATKNIDGILLTPEAGTALYDILAVHKELFSGLN
ncbi:hypothetical protein [Prochlorococcus marinus]|uniref:hypothetical protein n=1 Tax=Prochlorococcus marinus TaxID=1219 RepID=UPI0022B5BCE0|nr:hypothetical protein [Prochlorococcus marinus]